MDLKGLFIKIGILHKINDFRGEFRGIIEYFTGLIHENRYFT